MFQGRTSVEYLWPRIVNSLNRTYIGIKIWPQFSLIAHLLRCYLMMGIPLMPMQYSAVMEYTVL